MARIKGVRTTVDTDLLKKELREVGRATRNRVAELAKQSLEAQIGAIRNAGSHRREELDQLNITVSRGTQNDPLQGAKVVIDEDGMKVTASVEHSNSDGVNIFNALDAGIPARTMRRRAIFPAYEGTVTPESYTPEVGDPSLVEGIIVRRNRSLRDPRGGPAIVSVRAGTTVAAAAPREFYRATAEWVESQLLDKEIVTPTRRSRIRIKKGDVKISFTSEG